MCPRVPEAWQVYAPTSNAKEAEVERSYEDLQDSLELRRVYPWEGMAIS